jgi:hypothetical protein
MHVVCLCAPVSEFKIIFGCALFSLWQYLCLSGQRLCTKSKTLPSRGLPRAQCPRVLNVFSKFFKKFRQLCRDRSHEREVFYGSSNSGKVKMTVCMRWRVAYSFKAPSTNAPAATTRRLASTSLVSGFHPIPFREHSCDNPPRKIPYYRLRPIHFGP